ncbi:MAG TPA: ABC transporter ATP-binding protein [Gammaproteobacteria bacterium]|nr:ABC transporter ATP-binding protein [Gammaproteobacteria bacterium]
MIRVEHLTRRYGDFTAVDDVSFEISRGEVVGLLGHNGAGKTTIMKMLTGFLEPTAGTIHIDGLEVGRDTTAIQARIGYLPENCPVWPEMTVVDYLDYEAALHGVAEDKRPAAVAAAIRRTALKEKAAQPIQTLSRGYRQRVGVAQALLHDPDIIILDEPTNGLDPTQIRHMRELIRELAQHATVIVSTHILQEVQAVCERVLIMRSGQLVVDARMDALQKGRRLLLSVDGEARDTLAQVSGVVAVTDRGEDHGHRQYLLEAGEDAAPGVVQALCAAGLKVYALQPERRDLEAVFAEVNEGREVAHG